MCLFSWGRTIRSLSAQQRACGMVYTNARRIVLTKIRRAMEKLCLPKLSQSNAKCSLKIRVHC
ncbi:hypothetical protein PSAB6_360024 [Paraburkholderia sabiae]|nr:hypothetical protein PSAB6_360024 [Paraburkholderia sabiae]